MVVADKDVARIPITVIFFLSSAQFMKRFPTASAKMGLSSDATTQLQ